jgi:hypothetical protein
MNSCNTRVIEFNGQSRLEDHTDNESYLLPHRFVQGRLPRTPVPTIVHSLTAGGLLVARGNGVSETGKLAGHALEKERWNGA